LLHYVDLPGQEWMCVPNDVSIRRVGEDQAMSWAASTAWDVPYFHGSVLHGIRGS
jgi:hypothetical protein